MAVKKKPPKNILVQAARGAEPVEIKIDAAPTGHDALPKGYSVITMETRIRESTLRFNPDVSRILMSKRSRETSSCFSGATA